MHLCTGLTVSRGRISKAADNRDRSRITKVCGSRVVIFASSVCQFVSVSADESCHMVADRAAVKIQQVVVPCPGENKQLLRLSVL